MTELNGDDALAKAIASECLNSPRYANPRTEIEDLRAELKRTKLALSECSEGAARLRTELSVARGELAQAKMTVDAMCWYKGLTEKEREYVSEVSALVERGQL